MGFFSKRGRVFALLLSLAAATTMTLPGGEAAATPATLPGGEEASILRLSQSALDSAVFNASSLDAFHLAAGVESLLPVVGVLASFVAAPLKKDAAQLRSAALAGGDERGLDALVAAERASTGTEAVAASAYWSFLFLGFFESIVDGVLARNEAFEVDDVRADLAIRDSAKDAYEKHYAPRHGRVVRAIARKILNFAPSRERLFRALKGSGAARERWAGDLRGELHRWRGAVRPCVARLEATFRRDGVPRL